MQRYLAPDMRQALVRVRAELGPGAVILGSRRVGEGVEVTAAIDYDVEDRWPPLGRAASPPPPDTETSAAPAATLPEAELPAERGDLGTEVRRLRELLETQLAVLAWNDFTRREPHKAHVLEELARLGLARDVALGIVEQLPVGYDAAQSNRLPLAVLARGIAAAPGDATIPPGVLALVGPNGAGKTTTLAKLATRWVLERGPRELTLVSADGDRLGSHEQLQALGRLLGAPPHAVDGPDALQRLLRRVAGRGLVLIDTPGIAPRSDRVQAELAPLLTSTPGVEVALVLSASAQADTLERSLQRYRVLAPSTCVLTRLDEAASLGPALSMLLRSRLPVAWLCHGPRIPDDIERARPHQLVAHAVKLAARFAAPPDTDELARRFGGSLRAAV
jgi:flagellar biosynthesis protein FlhF